MTTYINFKNMQNETAYWLWHKHMVCGRVKKQEAINRIQKSSYLWGKKEKEKGRRGHGMGGVFP